MEIVRSEISTHNYLPKMIEKLVFRNVSKIVILET